MPLYSYACSSCHKSADEFRSVEERNNGPECSCGKQMRKVLSLSKPIGDVAPYYDDNLDTYVKSRQHRKQVMREKGVTEKFGQKWH